MSLLRARTPRRKFRVLVCVDAGKLACAMKGSACRFPHPDTSQAQALWRGSQSYDRMTRDLCLRCLSREGMSTLTTSQVPRTAAPVPWEAVQNVAHSAATISSHESEHQPMPLPPHKSDPRQG